MIRILFYIAVILLFTGSLHAQQLEAKWILADHTNEAYSLIQKPDTFDSLHYKEELEFFVYDLQKDGFLTAYTGPCQIRDSLIRIPFYLGPRYKWVGLHKGNMPDNILRAANYQKKQYEGTVVSINEMNDVIERILRESENRGYPFASVHLDSLEISDAKVEAALYYDAGPLIRFDSVQLAGAASVKKKWLMAHLHIRQGDPFNQSEVDRVGKRLRNLPFLEQSGDAGLTFQNEEATLELPLKFIPSNQIDGIIGFLPNEERDNGIRITGQLDLSLHNLFRSGKSLDLTWQRVKPLSQTLDLVYRHPDIFYSPLHFEGGFRLLKEDTTFINREFLLKFDYEPSPHRLSFFSRFKRTRLISTSGLAAVTELPELSDLNVNYYGVGYRFISWQQGWAGNRGWEGGLSFSTGDKEIIRNPELSADLYEGRDLRTIQWAAEGDIAAGLPISRRAQIYQRLTAGWMYDDQLFLNDLYRVGGFRSLRGFNENVFFASSYLVYTLEYQLYYEANSYLFVFLDQGLIENRQPVSVFRDYPTGIGAGLTLSTGAGLLQLAFALGRTASQPFNFSLSKFHFGYIAKF